MPFLLALGLGSLLMPVARWAGLATGVVDLPNGALRIHRRPAPLLGGLAVAVTAVAAARIAGPAPGGWAVAVAVAVSLAMGLTDDLRELPVWVRLAAQAAAGGVLAVGSLGIEPLGPFAAPAMVLVVPLVANAVNIVDGQDGLAGGLAAIAAVALSGVGDWQGAGATLGLALAGALVAFLVWNLPGLIFLGNGGAYAVGTMLAAQAAVVGTDWARLGGAILCLGVFALELVSTILRRLWGGTRLTAGDRGHSYDLLAVRVGRLPSTLAFWALGVALAGLGLSLAAVGGR